LPFTYFLTKPLAEAKQINRSLKDAGDIVGRFENGNHRAARDFTKLVSGRNNKNA
jgi:hypothetical protein